MPAVAAWRPIDKTAYLESLVEFTGRLDNPNLITVQINAWGNFIELIHKWSQHACLGSSLRRRASRRCRIVSNLISGDRELQRSALDACARNAATTTSCQHGKIEQIQKAFLRPDTTKKKSQDRSSDYVQSMKQLVQKSSPERERLTENVP